MPSLQKKEKTANQTGEFPADRKQGQPQRFLALILGRFPQEQQERLYNHIRPTVQWPFQTFLVPSLLVLIFFSPLQATVSQQNNAVKQGVQRIKQQCSIYEAGKR